MTAANESFNMISDGWTVRVRRPDDFASRRVLLLLHGWTGDETVMWIFTSRLAGRYWLLAPRAPIKTPQSGYGWMAHEQSRLHTLPAMEAVAGRLMRSYPVWAQQAGMPDVLLPVDVMGFSQGAVMAYALAAFFPDQVARIAALAGFFPDPLERADLLESFQDRPVYIAHGARDETVPIERAQEAVRLLQAHGARVIYCESDVGHKLSASCLRGLETFFNVAGTPPGR